MLHLLTVAAPVATLFVATGLTTWKTSLQLLLLGLGATAATVQLTSIVATTSSARIEFGAPLPFARAPWDLEAGQRLADPVIVPANLLGDAMLWCSAAIIIGTIVRMLLLRLLASGRHDGPRWRRPSRRVRLPRRRETLPMRREFDSLPARI